MRNKIFIAILILSMVFTLSACGGNGSGSGSGSSGIEWELTEDGYEADYDFGAETSDEGVLLPTLDKLDYSDLNALQESLQSSAETGMSDAGLGSFEFITDFEEMEESVEEAKEEGYEVGDLVYCSGMEEDDMDLAAFESGVYNNPMDGKYYQYSLFSSRSYYGAKNVNLDEIIETFKTTYGVTIDKAKLEKAVEAIEAKAMEPIPEDETAEEAEELEGEDAETEDEDSEELESDDLVFVDEDGNAIDMDDIEIEEEEGEDLEEDEGEDEEEYSDAEEDEGEDEDDEEYYELSEDEMNDLVFADEEGDFEGGYPCVMNQTIEKEGEGYTDKIVVSLVSQQISEEDTVIYMSIEVDRCYNEQ